MITIQADNVAELRQITWELFGPAPVVPGEVKELPKATPKAAVKKGEGKVEGAIQIEVPTGRLEDGFIRVEEAAAPGTVTVDVPDDTSDTRTATYEEVIALVKKLKASTVPDILDKVNAWKTSGQYPALKESSPEQLGLALTYIESLEG